MLHSTLRYSVISALIFALSPMNSLANDSAIALIHVHGVAWLNGAEVPGSRAMFPGDVVQTRNDSTSTITASGLSVTVLPDSLIRIEASGLVIEHGAIRVATTHGLAATAGDVTVKPLKDSWTIFQVTDVDQHIAILADKGDVSIRDAQGTTTLPQGQQATRENKNKHQPAKHSPGGGAPPAAHGPILSSTTALIGGAAVVGGTALWVSLQSTKPLSPSCPTLSCQ